MLIGQVCETVFLPLLPLFLWRIGMKWVLALGMLCWGIRYLLFSQAGPEGLPFAMAIIGIALHGFCFDFFFAAMPVPFHSNGRHHSPDGLREASTRTGHTFFAQPRAVSDSGINILFQQVPNLYQIAVAYLGCAISEQMCNPQAGRSSHHSRRPVPEPLFGQGCARRLHRSRSNRQ